MFFSAQTNDTTISLKIGQVQFILPERKNKERRSETVKDLKVT